MARLTKTSEALFDKESDWIKTYENDLAKEVLPIDIIEPLYEIFCLEKSIEETGNLKDICRYIRSSEGDKLAVELDWLPEGSKKPAFEIIKNLRYRPNQKIALGIVDADASAPGDKQVEYLRGWLTNSILETINT